MRSDRSMRDRSYAKSWPLRGNRLRFAPACRCSETRCRFFFLMIRRPPRSTQQSHSFPTRRSSDLDSFLMARRLAPEEGILAGGSAGSTRSEEHTSELQSRTVISYAVFCLKKKK